MMMPHEPFEQFIPKPQSVNAEERVAHALEGIALALSVQTALMVEQHNVRRPKSLSPDVVRVRVMK